MRRLFVAAVAMFLGNACTTIARGGYPSTDIQFATTVEQVRVELLAGGRIVESCIAPCTITARVADGYVLRFRYGDAEPVLLKLRGEFQGSPWLWVNALNLFMGALLDFESGALEDLTPSRIEIVPEGRTIAARAYSPAGDK